MRTHDITIPTKKKPIFPTFCIVCEKADPTSTMDTTVIGSNTGSVAESAIDVVLDVGVGSSVSRNTRTTIVGIPVCSGCESRIKWYHRLLNFATYTIWLLALLVAIAMPGPLWLRIVAFLAIIMAPPILSMLFPPAFGATILNGNATYEFKSKRIADEFRRHNNVLESSAVQESA